MLDIIHGEADSILTMIKAIYSALAGGPSKFFKLEMF